MKEAANSDRIRGAIAAYYDTSNGDNEIIDTKIFGEQKTKIKIKCAQLVEIVYRPSNRSKLLQ